MANLRVPQEFPDEPTVARRPAGLDALLRRPAPVVDTPPPARPKSLLKQTAEFVTNDIPELVKSGVDTSQANVQRSLTRAGLGDWKRNEAINRTLATAEESRVSPETRQEMADLKFSTEDGFSGVTPRSVLGNVAKSVANVPMAAGLVGAALQAVPHPAAKAAGLIAAGVANAADIGGSSSYEVEQQGGTTEQQNQANLEGAGLGFVTGLAEPLVINKVLTPGTSALRRIATGAFGEGLQETPEEGGQALVENRALGRPATEGVVERGVLGGTLGAVAGGLLGGAGEVATNVAERLHRQQPVDLNNVDRTGGDLETRSRDIPGVDTIMGPLTQFEAPDTTADEAASAKMIQNAVLGGEPVGGREPVVPDIAAQPRTKREPSQAPDPTDFIANAQVSAGNKKPSSATAPEAGADEEGRVDNSIAESSSETQAQVVTDLLNDAPAQSLKRNAPPTAQTEPTADRAAQETPPVPVLTRPVDDQQTDAVVDEPVSSAAIVNDALGSAPARKLSRESANAIAAANETQQTKPAPEDTESLAPRPVKTDSVYLPGESTQLFDENGVRDVSIVKNAVAALHDKLTGETDSKPVRNDDGSYSVGDAKYVLNRDGTTVNVEPEAGPDTTYGAAIEDRGGKYQVRLDTFNREAGETQQENYLRGALDEGITQARALARSPKALERDVRRNVVSFVGEDEQPINLTLSSIRKVGAALNGKPNDSLRNVYDNIVAGYAYAQDKLGGAVDKARGNLTRQTARGIEALDNLVAADDPRLAITFGELRRIMSGETDAKIQAQRLADATTYVQSKALGLTPESIEATLTAERAKRRSPETAANINVLELLQGELLNDPKLNAKQWLNDYAAKMRKVADNFAGTNDFTDQTVEDRRASDAQNELLTAEEVEADPTREAKGSTLRRNDALLGGTAHIGRPGDPPTRLTEARNQLLAARAATRSAREKILNNDKTRRTKKGVAQIQHLDQELAKLESMLSANAEAIANEKQQASESPARVGAPETQITNGVVTNNSRIPNRVAELYSKLNAAFGIPHGITFVDETAQDLPELVREIIDKAPDLPQFIAHEKGGLGYYIHIPQGLKNSEKAKALAHEYGHFIQRVVMDGLVEQVLRGEKTSPENQRHRALLADILGIVSPLEGVDPVVYYNGLSHVEREAVDEMFADRLAEALHRAFKEDYTATYQEAFGAQDGGNFFERLAGMLKALYDKVFAGQAKTQKAVDEFIRAMTGRLNPDYSDKYAELLALAGRRQGLDTKRQPRTQYNQLRGRAQLRRMMDNRYIRDVTTGLSHFLSTTAEMANMKNYDGLPSKTARWAQRQLTSRTGDVFRGRHGRDYMQLRHNLSAALVEGPRYDSDHRIVSAEWSDYKGYKPLLNKMPVWNKKFPQASAFMDRVFAFLHTETPMDKIPDNLNFVVEKTANGHRNVSMNVKETVRELREYMNYLHAFTTHNGMRMPFRENYWAKNISRENVLNREQEFLNRLQQPVDQLVWVKTRDGEWVQQPVRRPGLSLEEARVIVDNFKTLTSIDESPFDDELDIDSTAQQADKNSSIGKVSLFTKVFGATNYAKHVRKWDQAMWQHMSEFVTANPTDVILDRSEQAAKARAIDDKFGGWVLPGKKLTVFSRTQYVDWLKRERARLKDYIVRTAGREDLTDEGIREWVEQTGGQPGTKYRERNGLVDRLLSEESPLGEKARSAQSRFDASVARNYYDPVGQLEAAISEGVRSQDLRREDALRIKEVIIPALLGRLGQKEISASWRAAQAYLQTGMNLAFLPTAVLSSLAETAQIGIRAYDPLLGVGMWKAQGKMMAAIGRSLFTEDGKADYKKMNDLLKALGNIKDAAIEHALTASIESEYMPTTARKINAWFFEVTQLKRWTDFVRTVAALVGRDAIRDYATLARQGNAQAQFQAQSLGVPVDKVLAMTDEQLMSDAQYQTALYRWIEEATLRPGADTRPARASDPRLALVWYLKDFPWAMQGKTLSYVMQQSKLQPDMLSKVIPWVSAAIPMMIVGAIGAYIKDLLTNQAPAYALGVRPKDTYEDAWTNVSSAIKRSGMMGVMEMPLQFAESYEHKGIPWIGLVSPAASVLQDMAIRGAWPALSDKVPFRSALSKPVRDAIWDAY